MKNKDPNACITGEPMKVTSYIEKDQESGLYIATVPSIPGAHTQAKSLDEL